MGFAMESIWKQSWLLVVWVVLVASCCTGLYSLPSRQIPEARKQSGASSDRPVSTSAQRGMETTFSVLTTVNLKVNVELQTPYSFSLASPKDVTADHSVSHAATGPEQNAAAGVDSFLPNDHDVVTVSDPTMMTEEVPNRNTATFSHVTFQLQNNVTVGAGHFQTSMRQHKNVTFVADSIRISTRHLTPVTTASVSLPITPDESTKRNLRSTEIPCSLGITVVHEHRSFHVDEFNRFLRSCENGNDPAIGSESLCLYEGAEAKCIGGKERLTCPLPELPSHIRSFSFVGNLFSSLSRGKMTRLSGADLRVLRLHCNHIRRLWRWSFGDFPFLEWLDLTGNPMRVLYLRKGLESIRSSRLKRLDLNFMDLTSLPDDLFDMFASRSLETLSLRGNHLQTFRSAVFAPFLEIGTLDLSHNAIFSVDIATKLKIQDLVLTNNIFEEFPNLCLHHSPTNVTNAIYNLNALYVDHNRFVMHSPFPGSCFPHLVTLDISSSPTRKLPRNLIAELPRLQHLLMNDMIDLQVYEPDCFKSLSLKTLTLRGNMKITARSLSYVVYESPFSVCPNLEELTIADTAIELSEGQLWDILVPLTSLTSLTLQRVSLDFVPRSLLWQFSKLRKLNLAGNDMTMETLSRALENVSSLQHLEIQDNEIQALNDSILPWSLRRHLTYLDVSSNPFSCTCELRWFKRWIEDARRNHSLTVHHYPSKNHYVCRSPPSRQGLPLQEFQPTEEDCVETGTGIVLVSVGLGPLVLLSVFIGVAYRYRWYLRFYLYRCRRLQAAEGEADGPVPFEYDVYLAYSSEELTWVCEHLLPLLEEDHGLRAFLHDRDTLPGTVIADNIPRFMDQCARVVVLLSQTYLRQQWRLYEFHHIVYAATEQQKDVVAVLLGDVEAGRLTREMRRMLTRGTFLQWAGSQEAQNAFRQGLAVALRTREPSCETLC